MTDRSHSHTLTANAGLGSGHFIMQPPSVQCINNETAWMYGSNASFNMNAKDGIITDNKPQISSIMIMSENDSKNDTHTYTHLTNTLMVT